MNVIAQHFLIHASIETEVLLSETKKSVIKQFQMKGNTYSVVIVNNDKNDPLEPLMYFISTLQGKTEILDGYRIRWHRGVPNQICFKHLKSNGFNLEDLIRAAIRFVKIPSSV